MKRLSLLLLLAVLASGCRTTAMKGTPFYTGEHGTREGPVEDRVNLWPLAYYRAPALSVLWPIGDFSDDRFAVRPLFSMYRDGKDAPWHEYNWLGGLVSVDTETHDRVAFPVFWGRNYFNVFPLFWSGSDPIDGSSHNTLFPLWVYSRKSNGDLVEFFPWPIAGHFLDGTESRWFLFPLWDRTLDREDPTTFEDRFGLALAGRIGRGDDRRHWIVPFYYARTGGPDSRAGRPTAPAAGSCSASPAGRTRRAGRSRSSTATPPRASSSPRSATATRTPASSFRRSGRRRTAPGAASRRCSRGGTPTEAAARSSASPAGTTPARGCSLFSTATPRTTRS